MPSIRLSGNQQWRGIFKGDFFGNLWFTKNIDLERSAGKIMLSDSYSSVFKDTDTGGSNLKTAFAFIRTAADGTDRYWAAVATGSTGGRLYKTTNTNPESGWAEDAIANTPTAALYDAIEFADVLYAAKSTDIDKLSTTWTNNWWSGLSGASALQSGVPHRFAIFAGAMLVTDGRFINDYDGTTARDPALTLPADQQADWIRAAADQCYMGGQSVGGAGEAEIFFWDRTASTFNSRYGSGDSRVFAGFTVFGIPYIITRKGEIKRFTGQGFRTVNQFPCAELGLVISNLDPNGVVVDKNIVKILVTFGASTATGFGLYSQRILDGFWMFNADTNNLYHSGGLTNTASNDFGQGEVSEVGAVIYTNPTQGRYLLGGRVYTAYTGTTRYAIFSSDEENTANRGYVITPKIQVQNAEAFFRRVHLKFRKLDTSTDRIRLLYRIQDSNTLPSYETITWVNATSFTGTNANVAANDFVEIISGANAGAVVKISSITAGSPNTYNLESLSLNASTAAARARYIPFIDVGTISSQTIQKQVFNIQKRSSWLQLLIELRGTETSPQLEEIIIEYDDLPL